MSEVAARVRDFIATVNKTYEGGVVEVGGKFKALKLARFSSGIVDLDVALGGGWPFGRVAVSAGEYSTGKSVLALRACEQIPNYDHATKKHKDYCTDGKFEPGTALYIDVEGAWDEEWSKANGIDLDHVVVARPEHSEQAIDIVTTAIKDNIFDLIVIDSIAAMIPIKELEESAEDWQMGLAARLNNKAFRKWNSQLNKMSQTGKTGPFVLCINQFRMKIGIMFGDPRTLPGGKGQEFCSCIIIYMKSAEYEDAKERELAYVDLRGVVYKNKTYVPKVNFSFNLCIKDAGDIKKGTLDNISRLMELGKKYKLISTGSKVKFGAKEFATQKEMTAMLAVSEPLRRQLWRSIVKTATDILV